MNKRRKCGACGGGACGGAQLVDVQARLRARDAAYERAAAERAAAERAAAHKWQLSPREIAMQKMLGVKTA